MTKSVGCGRAFSSLSLTLLFTLATFLTLLTSPAGAIDFWDRPDATRPGAAEQTRPVRWLDQEGRELPFKSHAEALDFLRRADVISSRRLSEGINRTEKLTLELDGVVAHAVFRTVNRDLNSEAKSGRPHPNAERDSYAYEVAAYELSHLLGLDRVPPVVMRRINNRSGSLQLWIEHAVTEASLLESDRRYVRPARRVIQRQTMQAFDNLIYNFDRHQGNMLYDSDDFLWYIDHTRSFKPLARLQTVDDLAIIERCFFEGLQSLDKKSLKSALSPYLQALAIDALDRRRQALLKHYEGLIAKRGEDAVLVGS